MPKYKKIQKQLKLKNAKSGAEQKHQAPKANA